MILVGLEDHSGMGGSPDRDTSEADPDFRDRAAERIIRRVPGLIEGTFRTSHSGQDGLTPDERPILGPAGPRGSTWTAGTAAPGSRRRPRWASAMSELILDGAATSVDIAPFALERFAAGRPLVGEHGGDLIWK